MLALSPDRASDASEVHLSPSVDAVLASECQLVVRDCRGRKSKWVAATVANMAEKGQPAFARGFEHKRSQKRSGL
ncbi:hypothetical protein TGFOU_405360 [Toxoplasma gondii FOU]|uniref:Uncharacterized protein n=1 Tax=Toxoplasma gondii FOU TaxID=943167 RepID=A0A086KG60_TOXGO|nr:hypothetical protein TGFOU_405360 [Toxoplasma gondii FOU]